MEATQKDETKVEVLPVEAKNAKQKNNNVETQTVNVMENVQVVDFKKRQNKE